MAHEGEKHRSVRAALVDAARTVSLFVGPEGGFAPDEVACAKEAGGALITPWACTCEATAAFLAGGGAGAVRFRAIYRAQTMTLLGS